MNLLVYVKFLVFIFTFLYSCLATSLVYKTINLNIDDDSFDISLSDKKCEFILDNNLNFEILKKSENSFTIKSLKINETSGTAIFDCEKEQYIYRVLYVHGFSQSSMYNQREFKGYSYLNYNLKIDKENSKSQTFQYIDGSHKNIFFRSARYEYDYGQYENNVQLSYTGDILNRDLVNNLYSSVFLGDGNDSIGKYNIYQTAFGLYEYIITYQELRYLSGIKGRKSLMLNLPNPLSLLLSYEKKSDLNDKYSLQRIFSFGFNKFQSYHILNVSREVVNNGSQNLSRSERTHDSYLLNSFSNYFFSSFIYQQLNSKLVCLDSNLCQLERLQTSYNFQNTFTRTQVKYGFIPHSLSFYLQKYFWKENDISLGYSKTFSPIQFLQDSEVTHTDVSNSKFNFYSMLNLRHRIHDFFVSLSLPLLYLNQESSSKITLQYENKKWIAYAALNLTPAINNNWNRINWQFSSGVSYYPSFGLKNAIDYVKTHKIKGHIFSNLNAPEGDIEVKLYLPNQEIMEAKTDSNGYYEFIGVPNNGNFQIKYRKGAIESESKFFKETSEVEKKVELDLPYYTVVSLSFILQRKNKEEDLNKIVNYIGGYSIVSAEDAIYSGNKIILKRGKMISLKLNPEILPFGYNIIRLSEQNMNTIEKDKYNVKVYLSQEI